MRRHIALPLLALSLLAPACGPDLPAYTVGGKTLSVTEQNFGAADYYCNPLANGQFMVVFSDLATSDTSTAPLCDQVHLAKSKNDLAKIFHGGTETNLRLIFPSMNLKRVPPQNVYKVGKADCVKLTTDPADTAAIALFSHSTSGMKTYDYQARATSGSITLLWPWPGEPPSPTAIPGKITGSFDLTFETGDRIKGTFDAPFCMGSKPETSIGPGFGD